MIILKNKPLTQISKFTLQFTKKFYPLPQGARDSQRGGNDD